MFRPLNHIFKFIEVDIFKFNCLTEFTGYRYMVIMARTLANRPDSIIISAENNFNALLQETFRHKAITVHANGSTVGLTLEKIGIARHVEFADNTIFLDKFQSTFGYFGFV